MQTYQRETFPFSFYSSEKELKRVHSLQSVFIAEKWNFGPFRTAALFSGPINKNADKMNGTSFCHSQRCTVSLKKRGREPGGNKGHAESPTQMSEEIS